MKQLLTKEDVAEAIKDLEARGKKVTCTTLHAALGNRGSMSTLLKLKSEIDGSQEIVADSPVGLKLFREVWTSAMAEGRQLQQITIGQLREELKALATENERLDGLAIEYQHATEAAESEQAHTVAELKSLQAGMLKAAEETNRVLSTLAEERAAHASEMAKIRHELAAEVCKVHKLELELIRLQGTSEPEVKGTTRDRCHRLHCNSDAIQSNGADVITGKLAKAGEHF